MFQAASERKIQKAQAAQKEQAEAGAVPNAEGQEGSPEDEAADSEPEKLVSKPEDAEQVIDREVAEKEKMLAGVRQYAISMSSDIKALLNNEWAGTIKNLEGEKNRAESEAKAKIQ